MRSRKCHTSGRSRTRVRQRGAAHCSSCATRCCARTGRCGRWLISRSRPNTAVGTGLCTADSTRGRSLSHGCVVPWPGCRYRGRRTVDWSWPWPSRRGCGRTPAHTLTGPLPHLRPGRRQAPDGAWLAVPGGGRAGDRPHGWTAVLDAVRLESGAGVAAVTTVQIRGVVERLVAAGQWRPGDPEVLIVLDAGYDAPRIAHLLGDQPVETLGRLRSDRVMRRPTPSRESSTWPTPTAADRPSTAASSSLN